MIALRKGLPLVAGAAMLFGAGTASAQIDLNDWILDLSNLGGPQFTGSRLTSGGLGLDSATFQAPTRVITTDNGPPGFSVGDTQLAIGQGTITRFFNQNLVPASSADVGPTNTLGVDFEVTFVFEINEVITSVDPISGGGENVGFDHTGGTLRLYIDSNINYSGLGGTGADDGLLVAEFDVVPGALGGNINTANNDGNVNIVLQATTVNAGFLFLNDGTTDISTLVDASNDPLLIGLSDSNFNILTQNPNVGGVFNNGIPGGTDPGNFPGGPFNINDFIALEDGSINIAVLPEPGTLAVFGLGLLGLGLAVRRRQRVTA